jgi:hypothetical protein
MDDQPPRAAVEIPGAIACRPVNPGLYPGPKRSMWRAITGGNPVAPIAPGSEYGTCYECSMHIVVVPRQQELLRVADALGAEVTRLCLVCAVMERGGDLAAVNVANPYQAS